MTDATPDAGAAGAPDDPSDAGTLLIVTTGVGGSGVTTLAASTAVLASNRGARTLLLSCPDATSLPSVLDHEVGEVPTEIDDNLFAKRFSAQSVFEAYYKRGADQARPMLDAVGLTAPDAAELTAPPGVADVLLLAELVDLARGGEWDVVVLDGPPLPAALRLLALADGADGWLRRLKPTETQAARALHPMLAGLAGLPIPQRVIVQLGDWLQARVDVARELLTGRQTSVRIVTTPDSVGLAALRQARTVLALHGLRLDGVVVNKVLTPTASRDVWLRGWVAAQQAVLDETRSIFDGTPVHIAPYRPAEPIGLEELSVLGATAYETADGGDPLAVAPGDGAKPLLEDGDAEYVLVFPLPQADRRAMDLIRKGDELTVTVGTFRRSFTLPGVLRRCTVTGAVFRDGALRVRFVPDRAQWPAALADQDEAGQDEASRGERRT